MIPYEMTSHEAFSHDSISSLGYDWERIANPGIQPKFPYKVYFPRTTEDIVTAVREAKTLGHVLRVRSKGHSSNDLVLADGGAVLCTELLHAFLAVDTEAGTIKVRSGTVLAKIDDYLRDKGFGLPVIGDHNHITAGGFSSVGGISPASHHQGLFVDNVLAVELVDWDGEVRLYEKAKQPRELNRILGGLGQYGVIATLTLRIVKADKWKTVFRNARFLTRNMDDFMKHSKSQIVGAGEIRMERGVWLEYPAFGRHVIVGQFSAYSDTRQSFYKSLRDRIEYGYLHFLGYWAGRLPAAIDLFVKLLGLIGIILSPKYATMKNIESFTDKVLDSTVGDPTRMFIALAPMEKYEALFTGLNKICRHYRDTTGCITFITCYVKGIRSNWLAPSGGLFCELMLYLGLNAEKMTPAVLDALVTDVDKLCIEQGAFRYMHTKTSKDPQLRQHLDPNRQYA